MFIPVNEPLIGRKELKNVTHCIKSGWISSKGEYIIKFEENFSKYCDVKYGVTTMNGTTALHLAVEALGIKKGEEIIIPSFTMIASAYAAVYSGATPVLVDSEPETWNIDTTKIEEKITKKTRAIMPVHIYGHPVDMAPILKLAQDYNLFVVEDAAEAHGAEYKGKKVGGLGDVGCFSFYANKIITTGEGGMMVTNDKKIYERAAMLKDLSFSEHRRFLHESLGYNYRMTNLQAAIGLAQLEKIEDFVKIKRRNASLYSKLLKGVVGITLPTEKDWAKNVYWMYSILIDKRKFGIGRDEVQKRLFDRGIETRTFFIPMHQQPVFRKMGFFRGERYPVAERISREGLYLPSGLTLTKQQIEYVCDAVKEIKEEASRS